MDRWTYRLSDKQIFIRHDSLLAVFSSLRWNQSLDNVWGIMMKMLILLQFSLVFLILSFGGFIVFVVGFEMQVSE